MRRVFPAYGVRFIAINDNVDTANEGADDLAVSVKNIMNEAYARDISIKTRSALDAKRRNGDFVGPFSVYGYIKSGEQHYAAGVVREIFRRRLDGFSAQNIAEKLNQEGILSPLAYRRNNGTPYATGGYSDHADCKWSATTVIRILQDETYTGTLVQGKQSTPHFKLKAMEMKPASEWARVENVHEAIISRQDYELVQRIREIDTRTPPSRDSVFIFSGVLICGCCGGRMTRKVRKYKDTEYVYYFCPTGKKHGCTAPTMMKENDLIGCVTESLKVHIENVISLDSLLSTISQERLNREGQITNCEAQLTRIASYKGRLYENLINGCLTKEEYLGLKKQYSDEYDALQAAITGWQEKITAVKENRSERSRWINQFRQFEGMQDLDRKAVVQLIRSIRIVGKSQIEITFNYDDEYEKAVAITAQLTERRAV